MEAREVTEPVEELKKEEAPKTGAMIAIDAETNALAPSDHGQLVSFIKQMILAKAIPKHLENVAQVLSAWNFAAQLKLPPQPSLRNIAVIKGTPSLFGELPLALVQKHPDFISIQEFTIDKDYNRICFENKNLNTEVFGGVCVLHRKGMEKPQSFAFTVEDATRAGINAPKTSTGQDTVWFKYPQIMYVRRARSMAIKSLFADAITGASIMEHDYSDAYDLRDVGPTKAFDEETDDKASKLNKKFNIPRGSVVAPGLEREL